MQAGCINVDTYQGGESRDLFWLFCACIRTERVRKYSHAIKRKYLVFQDSKRIVQCSLLCAVVLYTTSSKDRKSLLEAVSRYAVYFLTASNRDRKTLLEVVRKNTACISLR